MTERPVLAVGLMSGTSLDGMDAALVRIDGPTHVQLLRFLCRGYSAPEQGRLRRVLAEGRAADLARLHAALGTWAMEAVERVLAAARCRATELGFIAFPGQTVWHEPRLVSWQLGEPAILAERFGVRVVSNFRSRDVAAGGQGAPLVPMADLLLFSHPEHARVLLNLGGMANLTFVPPRGAEEGAAAFDTGPGVAVIDAVARLTDPSLSIDRDGVLAREGRVDEAHLAVLLSDPFFATAPPRSTGREHFGDDYAHRLHARTPGPDGVRTAVELTARTVADAIRRWAAPAPEVVASGGGARHPVLWERLSQLLGPGRSLRRFDELFFDGDAKEAVAFALLGYLSLHGQPGNLPAATGAAGPRVLGSVTPP